nr:retrovirus-related Pol polyprotein from transposon TNT 1-94 [Tanacetum cinerariifolium]
MSSMGELNFFLGLQGQRKENGIFINQDKYVGEILKKFGFFSIRSASTPMETHKPLTKDENGKDVDVHLYRSMIGSLMYLTSSRPDIMFSVYTHFIRESYEKRLIKMVKIHTDNNVANLLTKAFDVGDEAVHKELGDIMERAATTASSLEAEQDIEQFWQTAALSTIEDGVMAITATIDRNIKVLITEASIRRHLKLGASEVQHQHGEPSTPESSPSRITSSPSLSPQHTSINAPSTSQPPNIQTTPVAKETTPMPHDSPLQSVHSLGSDKEELDMDVDISLVPSHATDQGRKLDDTQARDKGKAVMQESEPTKKIKKRIQVQISIDEELARKLHETSKDVMDLHRLVEERYTTTSLKGYDLMLWGDLETLFEPDEENELWKNQHKYNLIS